MIKVGIVGGTGYTAGELLRILVHHPKVLIDFVYSHSQAGQRIASVHTDLWDLEHQQFVSEINAGVDVVFLCLGHGNSSRFLNEHKFDKQTVIIDLSNDFRLNKDQHVDGKSFVYGLPEFFANEISCGQYIANPGCFATAIQLALLPLAKAKALQSEVHINGMTGSTGAGVSFSSSAHFSNRTANVSAYKVFSHQHLDEIREQVVRFQPSFEKSIHFVPLRGPFSRGIFVTLYTPFDGSELELVQWYNTCYEKAAFVHVTNQEVQLKQVVNTNKALIQVQLLEGQAFITVAIDNLLKGASGQAVQNMNMVFGLPQNTGLNLKANFF